MHMRHFTMDTAVCAYCGKVKPVSEMEEKTVLHYVTQRHLDKPDWYCLKGGNQNEPELSCANMMQWSLEG